MFCLVGSFLLLKCGGCLISLFISLLSSALLRPGLERGAQEVLASHIHLEAAKKHLAGRPLLWSELDAYADAEDADPDTEKEDDGEEEDDSGSDKP